jgi:hypothetical protein
VRFLSMNSKPIQIGTHRNRINCFRVMERGHRVS